MIGNFGFWPGGIGFDKPNVPEAFEAITGNVCWIEWVAKCKHG